MRPMTPPRVPDQPVPVLSGDELRALLATCKSPGFEQLRDEAIIRLLADTGMRRAELLGLSVEGLDLDQDVAVVMGKGRRQRACPFAHKTGLVLDRYLRARGRHLRATLPSLWLARRGPLSQSGLRMMLQRRGQRAGIGNVHPH